MHGDHTKALKWFKACSLLLLAIVLELQEQDRTANSVELVKNKGHNDDEAR